MDHRGMILKVHKAFERELRAFIAWEGAVLARPECMMAVKVALQRMLVAEDVSSF